jgi:hypothetical protein
MTAPQVQPLKLQVVTAGTRRSGVRVQLTCSHACLASVRLEISARDALRLGLSRSARPFTVAARNLRLDGDPRRVRLRLRAVVRHAPQLSIRMLVSAVDVAGRRAGVDRTL